MTTSAPRLLARLVGRRDDARGIALDVADHQVELRHDTTQPPRTTQSMPPIRTRLSVLVTNCNPCESQPIIRHCRAGRIEACYSELS